MILEFKNQGGTYGEQNRSRIIIESQSELSLGFWKQKWIACFGFFFFFFGKRGRKLWEKIARVGKSAFAQNNFDLGKHETTSSEKSWDDFRSFSEIINLNFPTSVRDVGYVL
jgi:hypothetical protein